jgi:hypothetical protein
MRLDERVVRGNAPIHLLVVVARCVPIRRALPGQMGILQNCILPRRWKVFGKFRAAILVFLRQELEVCRPCWSSGSMRGRIQPLIYYRAWSDSILAVLYTALGCQGIVANPDTDFFFGIPDSPFHPRRPKLREPCATFG